MEIVGQLLWLPWLASRMQTVTYAGRDDGGAAAAMVRAPAPVKALGGIRIVCVAAGLAHTAACCDAGGAYAWGWNADGQLVSCLGLPVALVKERRRARRPSHALATGQEHASYHGLSPMVSLQCKDGLV